MKHPVLLLTALLLFAGIGFNCHHDKVSLQPTPLTGKLVLNGPCGQYVVQVLSGNIDSARIVKSWTIPGDTNYSNVFAVSNSCTFGEYKLSRNDVFTFALNDTSYVQTCMLCMIYSPTPGISNIVSHVQLVSKGQ